MGLCLTKEGSIPSRSKSSIRRNFVGAIVVFGEGEEGEFLRIGSGTRVQSLLEEYAKHMICNCNEVIVGESVRDMDMDDELKGGEIYFLLPETRLNSVFTKADMASMVSKANYAIANLPKFSFRKEEAQIVMCHDYQDSKLTLLQHSYSSKFMKRPLKWSSKLLPISEMESL